jgi:hypothetical protein
MNDQFWQTLRYVLIGGGGFLAGRGKIDAAQVVPLVDQIITIGSGAVSLGAAVWGLYVKFRTATVPAATAARADVPVVNTATGAVT